MIASDERSTLQLGYLVAVSCWITSQSSNIRVMRPRLDPGAQRVVIFVGVVVQPVAVPAQAQDIPEQRQARRVRLGHVECPPCIRHRALPGLLGGLWTGTPRHG